MHEVVEILSIVSILCLFLRGERWGMVFGIICDWVLEWVGLEGFFASLDIRKKLFAAYRTMIGNQEGEDIMSNDFWVKKILFYFDFFFSSLMGF